MKANPYTYPTVLCGLIGLLLVAMLFCAYAEGQPAPAVTADSWYCTNSSYDQPVCFQFGKIALIGPAMGYVSLVSGEAATLDAADFKRLLTESRGLIPAGLGQPSGVASNAR